VHVPQAALRRVLSADELERAEKFYFARDKARFVMARALLRRILSGYLDELPERLRFEYGPYGKPRLAAPESPIRFNVSHSGDFTVFAVGSRREIGIDIERRRATLDIGAIARRNFSRAEIEALSRVRAESQVDAFFAVWTRKESYCKALGTGLTTALDSFTVTVEPDRPPALLEPRAASGSEPWTLLDLGVGREYAAALTVAGRCERLTFTEVSEPPRTTLRSGRARIRACSL
jgi:4'-phosphopantetheinyl transferase